jgi:arylamine N-acetyltransferase
MTKFNISFSNLEIQSFLERIEVETINLTPECLRKIISGIIEHIPFQNISMLTDKRVRPNSKKIKHDMLSGHGGLCTVRNPFLQQLLVAIGFEARFVSSTINEPDCHISILVNIDGDDWWVDVGNGYPYLEPIKLGSSYIGSHPFIDYRVIEINGRWHVQHRRSNTEWKTNHHFSADGVNYSRFDKMHDLHYSTPGWGPFLTGLRINRWWKNGYVILKDFKAYSPLEEVDLSTPFEIKIWLKEWFPKSGFNDSINIQAAYDIWLLERSKLVKVI